MTSVTTLTEATFAKKVLAAQTPMLVLFGSRACAASRVLRQLLVQHIDAIHGLIGGVQVDVDRSSLLAEHYGVMSTPTLLVFDGGDVVTRIVGFIPQGLVHTLVDQLCQAQVPHAPYWQPVETLVEDTVILPLLHTAGFLYQRQVSCQMQHGSVQQRGRIDVLVYDTPDAQPFTLIESKRLVRTERDLHQAARQALFYAQALRLPSFLVAAPSGMWLFRRNGSHPFLEQSLSSLDIHCTPQLAVRALQRLKSYHE